MSDWHHAFDVLEPAQLRRRDNAKWGEAEGRALPLWVADMDLPIAPAIREALQERLTGDNFGYPPRDGVRGLRDACADRMRGRYGWAVDPRDVLPIGGVIPAMYASVRAFTEPGDGVLYPTPLYPWFERSVEQTGRTPLPVELRQDENGRYLLDVDRLAERIDRRTRMIMLCNPHNPIGRLFERAELEAVATLAVEHDLWIVSDELHADLSYGGTHVPVASLGPEVARRTITLYGPTKAFNIAGLAIGFAIATDEEARERLAGYCHGPVAPPNVLAQVAARAALTSCDAWLDATLAYLDQNRQLVADVVRDRLPDVRHAPAEATYLAWLDFRGTPIAPTPAAWLREHANVILNEGSDFGAPGRGFARLNFATSRSIVAEALERIVHALEHADPEVQGPRADS